MNHPDRTVSLRGGIAIVAALLFLACAGGQRTGAAATAGGGAGQLAAGTFSPGGTPATSYGERVNCPPSSILKLMVTDTADQAQQAQKPAPQQDGRFCAIAQALLSWDEKQRIPENVAIFVANYYGVLGTPRLVPPATIDVENERDLASRLEEPLMQYARQVSGQVRYGIATGRGSAGGTKVALAMQEPQVDIDPFPRMLDPNAQSTLSGRLVGTQTNPKILISDPKGKLQQPESKPGKEFSVPVSCGGLKGRMAVEIRGEEGGQPRLAAAFPVTCGVQPPTSVAVGPAAGSTSQQERAIFDAINAERTEAGIKPLVWDDKVAQVARQTSEAEAQAAKSGSAGTAGADVGQRLKEAGIASPLALQNPAESRTAMGAQERFSLSPVHRANYMNTEATRGGVGVVTGVDPQAGGEVAFVTELFIRELAQVDVATSAPQLRDAIEKRRRSAGVATFKDDPALDKVAQDYANALAAAGGNISDAKHSQLVTPLYRNFRTVDFLSGAKVDPLEFADEKTVITSKEKSMGIGLAQGSHPSLGKNATYVVLLFGTRK
jgi:uncharacterized protein YkwD